MSFPPGSKVTDFIDERRARAEFEITDKIAMGNKKKIGEGSRGDVYEASMGDLRVAVKFPRAVNSRAQKEIERLLRELFVWNHLNTSQNKHDNIATLFGLYYAPTEHFAPGIVSLFVEHELKEYAASHPAEKPRLMDETARGVEWLHLKGAIHGDLKPDNVRVSDAGVVKIIDFGMGKLESVEGCTTIFGANPRYFAPELYDETGKIRLTYKSDVYSFGMLLLQILHGYDPDTESNFDRSIPFNEILTNNPAAMWKLCNAIQKGRRPRQDKYRVTPTQWEFLEECWHADPIERPPMPQIVMRLPQIF